MSDTTAVEPTNVLNSVAAEIEELLSPLTAVIDSPDPIRQFRRFLRSAGWAIQGEVDPEPIVDSLTASITAVVDAVVAMMDGIEPDDLGQFLEALDQIRVLITEIKDLIDIIADGGPASPTPAELEQFATDVLHTLLARWLRGKGVVGEVLALAGLLEPVDVEAMTLGGWLRRSAGRSVRLTLDPIGDLLNDPVGALRERYVPNGWASAADAASTNLLLSHNLNTLLRRIGGSWRVHPDALAAADQLADVGRTGVVDIRAALPDDTGRVHLGAEFEFFGATDLNEAGETGPAVEVAPFGGYDHTFDLDGWALTVAVALALGGVDVGDSPPVVRFDADGVDASPSFDGRVEVAATIDVNSIIGGSATRVQLGALNIGAFVGVRSAEFDVGFSLVAEASRIVLSAADLGAALGAVASFETEIEFDLGLAWSLLEGLHLAGSAALEIEFTEGIDIGGIITLSGLRLRAEVGSEIGVSALTNVGVSLGPVAMAFEELGMGLALTFPPDGGNLGGANLGVTIEPPKGIGVRVDAGVVVGGGYLYMDPDRGEYAGVLELSFPALSLSIKAVGIFTTELPGDAEGYALLLLVYTEFPAIQLGYGFTLNGLGGILGIQHGVSIDALQAGMRTGALDNVLFPNDPVANAPALLDDLRAIFPISPGSLTFGPALQIGWGAGILTVSLGLVMQFDDVIGSGDANPSIARIVLLGQLRVVLPPIDDAPELVKLLVDILGYYDFDEKELGIDARLRDSHLVGLPLTGSLVVRARFGDDPTFVLAIGGFHPRFTDLPPGIPPQDRLGVQLRYGMLTVSITCYTAITSNSFQFGAEASLVAEAASFKVEAYLGFDALFLFEPTFHFTFEFRVGAAISWKKWDLASIRVRGMVSGPGRWEIEGSATFSVLFWDVEIDFREAWGQAPVAALPEAPILPKVLAELAEATSWSASLPGGRALVTLRDPGTDSPVLAHPLGSLHVRQKVVPLGIDIERVGEVRPSDHQRFDITAMRVGATDVVPTMSNEHFARGDYFDLSEDDKLGSPSFERFDAGASVGTDAFAVPSAVAFDPEYETVYLEQPDVREWGFIPGLVAMSQARYGAIGATQRARADRLVGTERLAVSVVASPYVAVDTNLSTPSAARATTFTEASRSTRDDGALLAVVEMIEL